MDGRDPRCVYVAYRSMGEAAVVASFLEQHGIASEVMNQATLGGLEGLTALVPGVSSRGIEVWVLDPGRVREAVGLLAEAEAERLVQKDEEGEPIYVMCEECGAESSYPYETRGTCQNCPRCGSYVDVESDEDHEPPQATEDELEQPDDEPSDGFQLPPGIRPDRK
jgi:hypothetical protein